ncbi:MAG: PfkB family carbohydrate kinase, partial [Phycisphaerae bacterium]|nr:PfkB family carbohydrate kinase [Phycisphaerae bacterium]
PGIDRIFFHSPGTNNTFESRDVDYELVARAKLFHLGYPPLMRRMHENDGAEMIKIFKKVKETGTITSLDMSLPDPNSPSGQVDWHKILKNLLPYVDIFQPSIEEGTFMARRERFFKYRERCKKELLDEFSPADYSDLGEQFLAWGSRIASIKTGHRGIYIRTADAATLAPIAELLPMDTANWANREIWAPAYKIQRILSATGSGDSSIAGLLAATIRGLPIEQAAKMSSSLGYQNLHELDAISGIRGWDESVAITEDASIGVIPPNIDDAAWQHDEDTQTYRGPADKA